MDPVTEEAISRLLIPKFQQQGYEVILHPSSSVLPDFFGRYRPDLIALGRSDQIKNVAVEIKRTGEKETSDIQGVSALFKGQPDWEFQIFLVPTVTESKNPKPQSKDEVLSAIERVSQLTSVGEVAAAFLLGWATLEAMVRLLVTQGSEKRQTPGRVVELLAREGYVTPKEADKLRSLAEIRNRLVHGELDVSLKAKDQSAFVGILAELGKQLAESQAA